MTFSARPCTVSAQISTPLLFLTPWTTYQLIRNVACIRAEISSRLTDLNVPPLYIPTLGTIKPPPSSAHIPIHCTPPHLLRTKRRIIVLVNRAAEDLGVWSYRVVSKTGGINAGSVVSLVRELRDRAEKTANASTTPDASPEARAQLLEDNMPGILVLNPGCLLYSYTHGKALTPMSWDALPRKSAVHPPPRFHPKYNRVDGNHTADEHLRYVFDNVMNYDKFVSKDAEVYIVAAADGSESVIRFLDESGYFLANSKGPNEPPRHKIAAVALTAPLPMLHPTASPIPLMPPTKANAGLLDFLAKRARAWCISGRPVGTPIANPMSIATIFKLAHDAETEERIPGAGRVFGEDIDDPRSEENGLPNGEQSILDGIKQKNWADEGFVGNNMPASMTAMTDEEGSEGLTLYPMVSGGEGTIKEVIICEAWRNILGWFDEVWRADESARNGSKGQDEEKGNEEKGGYCNPTLKIPKDIKQERMDAMLAQRMAFGSYGFGDGDDADGGDID